MTGDVTIGYMKRISRTPEGDTGNLIGGQNYYNVEFTGGTMDGVDIGSHNPSDGTFNNLTVNTTLNIFGNLTLNGIEISPSLISAGGAAGALTLTSYFTHVSFNTGPSAGSCALPVSQGLGQIVVIKDATGSGGTHNITVTITGGATIDGAASAIIAVNYGAITLVDGALGWGITA